MAENLSDIMHNGRIVHYPDGSALVMASDRPIFREPGWESVGRAEREPEANPDAKLSDEQYYRVCEYEGKQMETSAYAEGEARRKAEARARAQRRAKNAIRDYALANPDFRWFVTLTLDQAKVDRYDVREITRKLKSWADNAVRRKGLKYVLIPERHKDGAIHFHGFMNDVLEAVDSGTMTNGGRPRRPRSEPERARLQAEGWRTVYNLPAWTLGFTTAIELYGDRRKAVAYVQKYITKQTTADGEKIGGRWYYSGGELRRPSVEFCEIDREQLSDLSDSWTGTIEGLGAQITITWIGGNDDDRV